MPTIAMMPQRGDVDLSFFALYSVCNILSTLHFAINALSGSGFEIAVWYIRDIFGDDAMY